MGDGPALLTLKLVLIFLPALIFMLLNAFLIAQDKLSEADTEREAQDGVSRGRTRAYRLVPPGRFDGA